MRRPERGQRERGPVDGPYRIAAVAELTGVAEATLRAWERRYGIPRPDRTAAGYRLYSGDQVRQVREMRRLCDEGVAAAEAAKLVAADRALGADVDASTPDAGAAGPPTSAYAAMVDAILAAVTAFDDEALEEHVRRLKLLGPASRLLDAVIAPVLVAVGDRWHAGELTIAQEHFATQKLAGLLRDLLRLSPGAGARDAALFASFADDQHEVGLLGFALRVSEWHVRPIILGARTPPSAVRSAVEALSPKLVALSTTILPPRAQARELVEDYAAACGDVPWIVGGAASNALADLVEKAGGHVAPKDPAALRALVAPLLRPAP